MFAAPSELLIATPLSSYSERLLVRPCISAYVQHATNVTEAGHYSLRLLGVSMHVQLLRPLLCCCMHAHCTRSG